MSFEVELKFPLHSGLDGQTIAAQLDELQARRGDVIEQRDLYFAHPARDFAQSDEALRVRSVGGRNWVTYKGPRIDALSKTRREIEVPFQDGDAAARQFGELLYHLGFREVRRVVKRRVACELVWEQRELEVALDTVDGLGQFVEIETITEQADVEPARDCIWRLARRLGLEHFERRSYLCLLLERDERT